ncbi:MAG: hypothetical protein L3K04_01630 [Thermoplasmata archaeon]|nr:hypothetical protein [Thermoplasmata archaeon]MCI4338658.1 hypothetical protein [Thermoplasmata archaeon]MCI4341861.1 hypothetical protein [Thermoplasmata archaeon]
MTLSAYDTITFVEVGVTLLGIAITWAVFYGSEKAELPGTAPIPDPNEPEDVHEMTVGRSLR